MVDFSDEDEARRWFQAQPRQVAVAMAARVALRALPMLVEGGLSGTETARYRSGAVLPCFHAAITSWLAAKFPAHRIAVTNLALKVYRTAVQAADVADGDVDDSTSAGDAAYSAGAAARAAHDAFVADSYAAAIDRAGPDIDARDHAEAAYRDFENAAAVAAVDAAKCGAIAVGACGFRGKAAGDSDPFQPPIPRQTSHRFRLKPATL